MDSAMRKPTPEEQALWPAPNFDNPEHLRAPVIVSTIAAFLLALACESNAHLVYGTAAILTPFNLSLVYADTEQEIHAADTRGGRLSYTCCNGTLRNCLSD